MNATIHMITGPIGAGKTTFAAKLADQSKGARFSIDEYMQTLFDEDVPTPLDLSWVFQRLQRCHKQITSTAMEVGWRGIDVVLDLGFTTKAHRKAFSDRAKSAGHGVKLYWVDTPIELRWQRIEHRNALKGPTYSFCATPEMFAFMDGRYEVPDDLEMHALNGERISVN